MDTAPIIEVFEDDFDLGGCWSALQTRVGSSVGAIAGFAGLVRERTATAAGGSRIDESVSALVLEHYPGMTEESIGKIVAEADERWSLLGAHVIHRVGRLTPGEQIVMVLVASGHRADAFAACEFIMDYLKTDAVFWKREDYQNTGSADGGEGSAESLEGRWLHSADTDKQRRAGWLDGQDSGKG